MTLPIVTFTNSVTFNENDLNSSPQYLFAGVTVTDPDNDFDGGRLTISGLTSDDQVLFSDRFSGAQKIYAVGNDIIFGADALGQGGNVIGHMSGGVGTTFTVELTAWASAPAIAALISALTYATTSNAPPSSHSLRLNLSDSTGGDLGPFSIANGKAAPTFVDSQLGRDYGSYSAPAFADLNGDGVKEVIIGSLDGTLQVNQVRGFSYEMAVGTANPLNGIDVGSLSNPAFGDVDGDGDADLVVGNAVGTLTYYRNGGFGTAGAFNLRSGAASPFDGISSGGGSAATLFDMDGDGDDDMVLGGTDGVLSFYRNGTGFGAGGYSLISTGIDVGQNATPAALDWDRDGDFDLVVGSSNGAVFYLRNGGIGDDPNFTRGQYVLQSVDNPFSSVATPSGIYTTTAVSDQDGDGNLEVYFGRLDGRLDAVEQPGAGTRGLVMTVNITDQNDKPVVSGLPAAVTVVEDQATGLNLPALALTDVDSAGAITVTLAASAGSLAAVNGTGVVVTGSGSAGLTLVGTAAAIDTWFNTNGAVSYTGAANVFGQGAANLTLSADDGSGAATLGVIAVNVTASNDAPTGTGMPWSLVTTEDTAVALDLRSLVLRDIDPGDVLTLTLAAIAGGSLSATAPGITVTGAGTETLGLTGTVAALTAALADANVVVFTPAPDAEGAPAAYVTAQIADAAGAVALGIVFVDILGVNDAPRVSGLPSSLNVTEDQPTALDLSAVTLSDVDSWGNITLTVSVDAGSLAAMAGVGVVVGGSGTGSLTLTGSASAIDGWLKDPLVVTYSPASNDQGPATLTLTGDDGLDVVQLGQVVLTIAAENDAPTVSGLPAALVVTEDQSSALNLSALALTDVDGDTLTLTLSASAGVLTALSSAGVTVNGSGSATLVLTGGAGALTAWLSDAAALHYTPVAEAHGPAAAFLAVTLDDGAGALSLGSIALDITPVDVAPVLSGLPATFAGVEDTATALDLSAVTLSDIDSLGPITLTLTTTAGTLTGTDAVGVTLAGKDSGTLILTGTAANIDAWLDANAVVYTGASNAFGQNAANLTLAASDGTSVITLGSATIALSERPDLRLGSAGAETIRGDAGRDLILALDGDDYLLGAAGADTLEGGLGRDTVQGGVGADVLNGGDGVDTVWYIASRAGVVVDLNVDGRGLQITAAGDAEGDVLSGFERVKGSQFADMLIGNALANTLLGGIGTDTLSGNAGSDFLYGELDADLLLGGSGADRFVFNTALGAGNVDQVIDFALAQGDRIVLDDAVFSTLSVGALALGALRINATGVAEASDDRIIYDSTTGRLSYDADGLGGGNEVVFAQLQGIPALALSGFLVI